MTTGPQYHMLLQQPPKSGQGPTAAHNRWGWVGQHNQMAHKATKLHPLWPMASKCTHRCRRAADAESRCTMQTMKQNWMNAGPILQVPKGLLVAHVYKLVTTSDTLPEAALWPADRAKARSCQQPLLLRVSMLSTACKRCPSQRKVERN